MPLTLPWDFQDRQRLSILCSTDAAFARQHGGPDALAGKLTGVH